MPDENPLKWPPFLEKYQDLDRLIKVVEAKRIAKHFLSIGSTAFDEKLRPRLELCASYVKGDHMSGWTISLKDLMQVIMDVQRERRERGLSAQRLREMKSRRAV